MHAHVTTTMLHLVFPRSRVSEAQSEAILASTRNVTHHHHHPTQHMTFDVETNWKKYLPARLFINLKKMNILTAKTNRLF